jgi:hypothetical protein
MENTLTCPNTLTLTEQKAPRQARDGVTAGHRRWSFLFLCMKKKQFQEGAFSNEHIFKTVQT